jgi:ubiquinone/menaquinone biosynthesis C-methylase UbiE
MADTGRWEDSYASSEYLSYNFLTRKDSVASLLSKDRFDTMLDLGCGTGDYASLLQEKSSLLTGLDFVYSMVDRARQRFSILGPDINFLTADANSLPFKSDSFDCIVAIGFIEYMETPDSILGEISRTLKDGGTVVIQSYKMDFYWLCAHFLGLTHLRKLLIHFYHKLKGAGDKLFSVDRSYRKHELDSMLSKHGFDVTDYRYDNFFLLPRFVSKMFPTIYIKLSNSINKKSDKFSFFAVNYVAKYRHNKASVGAKKTRTMM